MCSSIFCKVLVGGERMIVCRKMDLEKTDVRSLIRKAFPGYFYKKSFIVNYVLSIMANFEIVCCYKDHSSQFDRQINALENGNNWDKNPFIALTLIDKDDQGYCSAHEVVI